MNNLIRQTSSATFEQDVMQSEQLVLLDFWAPWCVPCRALEPILDDIAERFVGRVKVVKLNVDDHREVGDRYRIRGVPTLLILRNGAVIKHTTAHSRSGLCMALDEALGATPSVPATQAAAPESLPAASTLSFQNDPARKAQCLDRLRQAVRDGTLGRGESNQPSVIAAGGPGGSCYVESLGVHAVLAQLQDIIHGQVAREDVREAATLAVAWVEAMPVGVDMTGVLEPYYRWLLHNEQWGLARYLHDGPELDQFERLRALHQFEEIHGKFDLAPWISLAKDVRNYATSEPADEARVDIGTALSPLADLRRAALEDLHSYVEALATRSAVKETDSTPADAASLRSPPERIHKSERHSAYLRAIDTRACAFNRAAAAFLLQQFAQVRVA
jgi:thioredoxin